MTQMKSLALAFNSLRSLDERTVKLLRPVWEGMSQLTSLNLFAAELGLAEELQVEEFLLTLPLSLTSLDLDSNSLCCLGDLDRVRNSLTRLVSLKSLQLD